jgi:hypothetical protein
MKAAELSHVWHTSDRTPSGGQCQAHQAHTSTCYMTPTTWHDSPTAGYTERAAPVPHAAWASAVATVPHCRANMCVLVKLCVIRTSRQGQGLPPATTQAPAQIARRRFARAVSSQCSEFLWAAWAWRELGGAGCRHHHHHHHRCDGYTSPACGDQRQPSQRPSHSLSVAAHPTAR